MPISGPSLGQIKQNVRSKNLVNGPNHVLIVVGRHGIPGILRPKKFEL